VLEPTAYRETIVRRIEAPAGPFAEGIHTLSVGAGLIAVDGKRRRRDVRNAIPALRAALARGRTSCV
jgi:hypothetical protein